MEEDPICCLKRRKKKLLRKRNCYIVKIFVWAVRHVIRQVGQMLVDTGYVDQPYVDAMVEREKTCSTYMGNMLALPHGVEAAKEEVKASGIAVMIFPEGTPWGEEEAKIVIGVAGVGEEHLEILGIIADKILDEASAAKLVDKDTDVDTVYRILGGEE